MNLEELTSGRIFRIEPEYSRKLINVNGITKIANFSPYEILLGFVIQES